MSITVTPSVTPLCVYAQNFTKTPFDESGQHPGGPELILEWGGKECTKAFNDAGHSSDAKSQLKQYKIGELHVDDRGGKQSAKTTNTKVNSDTPKPQTRSCISIITCGLCG